MMDVAAYRPTRATLKQIRADAELRGIPLRTVHETRNTFLTLSAEDAPQLASTLVRVTHQPTSHASETYRRSHWLAMCEAVSLFKLGEGVDLHLPGEPPSSAVLDEPVALGAAITGHLCGGRHARVLGRRRGQLVRQLERDS